MFFYYDYCHAVEKIDRDSGIGIVSGRLLLHYTFLRYLSKFQMSFRSSMASTIGVGVFPEKMNAALELRGSAECVCPSDVDAKLSSIPYFRKTGGGGGGNRFPTLGGGGGSSVFISGGGRTGGWRGGNNTRAATDDGFQVWSNNRRRGVGGRIMPHATNTFVHPARDVTADAHPEVAESVCAGAGAEAPVEDMVDTVKTPELRGHAKFSSAAVKTGVDMEERLLARVKGKINKIGFSTYDATKTFMQQILDSDETGFLDELMTFVFQKAATESTFCPLYARLLHELADEFTHLRVIMIKLFKDYTAVFTEMDTVPDVGTGDYRAFVEAQERKKFRRGYSQFVAELVKYGEADAAAFGGLINQIVSVLEESYNIPDRTLTCEEYIDCLANMCSSAGLILSKADWAVAVKDRLEVLVKRPRSETPGLTNKGRFALMDIVDRGRRGWK